MEQLHRGEGIWAARWESVYVSVLMTSATVDLLETMHRHQRATIERAAPRLVTSITLVPAVEIQPLAEGVREKSAAMLADMAPQMLGAATVVGGRGFFPSLVRSLTAGAALLSRTKIPQQTFAEVAPAVTWVAELPGQDPAVREGAATLSAAVSALLGDAGVSLG